MKTVVRLLSVAGLFGYGIFLFAIVVFSGMSASSRGFGRGVWLPAIMPFFYLIYCFVSTFDFLKGRSLLVSGIVAHVAVAPVIIGSFGTQVPFVGLGGLVIAAAWCGMYSSKQSKSDV